jgi:hypothetical protein
LNRVDVFELMMDNMIAAGLESQTRERLQLWNDSLVSHWSVEMPESHGHDH